MKTASLFIAAAFSTIVSAATAEVRGTASARFFSDNVFFAEGGTPDNCGSFAVAKSFDAPTAGVYRIEAACPRAETLVSVAGRFSDEWPDGVALPAGPVMVEIYAKAENAKSAISADELKITVNGSAAEMPDCESAFAPIRPAKTLEWTDAEQRHIAYATWEVEASEDGVYAFTLHQRELSLFTKCHLDGLQVFYASRNHRDSRFDAFFNTHRIVVFLNKGRHVFDFTQCWNGGGASHCDARAALCDIAVGDDQPWPFNQKGIPWERKCEIGFGRVSGLNPVRDTSYMLRGDDAMVFRTGGEAVIDVATAAPEERSVRFVTESPADETGARSTNAVEYALSSAKTVAHALDTSRPGGWRWWVEDASGEVVHGPWAYAVAGSAPDGECHKSQWFTNDTNANTNVAVATGSLGVSEKAEKLQNSKAPSSESNANPVNPVNPVLIDTVDCTEEKGGPHDFRDNGTSRLVRSPKGAYRITGPGGFEKKLYCRKNAGGFWERCGEDAPGKQVVGAAPDWFAYTLRAKHPGRAHLVRCVLPNDKDRCVTAYSIDRYTGKSTGWIVRTGLGPASGDTCELAFFVWPNTPEVDVMVFNANGNKGDGLCHEGAVLKMELLEYPDGIPPLEEAACGWNPDREFGWCGEQTDIGPFERTMVKPRQDCAVPATSGFGQYGSMGWNGRNAVYDWDAAREVWRRFAETSAHFGQNFFSFPVWSYGMSFIQGAPLLAIYDGKDCYEGTSAENPIARDMLRLMLLEMESCGMRFYADYHYGRLTSPQRRYLEKMTGESSRQMILTADARGETFPRSIGCELYLNPASPGVRRFVADYFAAYGERYGRYPAFKGIRQRLWKFWPDFIEMDFRSQDLGFDDATVAEFAKDTGIALDPVGSDELAFLRRKRFIRERYGAAWESWRATKCLTAWEALDAALRSTAPDARITVENGAGGVGGGADPWKSLDPEFFAHRRDLGFGVGTAAAQSNVGGVEWNASDPFNFYEYNRRGGDAANPPIDKWPASGKVLYPAGFCNMTCMPAAPYNLEEPAKALAENRLERLIFGGAWVMPGEDEGVRRFARIWRAIPTRSDWRRAPGGGANAPVAVWWAKDGDDVLFWAVNRTDASRRVALNFDSEPSALVDCVTGNPVNPVNPVKKTQSEISLAPFMPFYGKAIACAGIACAAAEVDDDEIAAAKKLCAHLASIAPKAKNAVEVQPMKGEYMIKSTGEGYAGPACRADVSFGWETLYAPIRDAAEAGDWFKAGELAAAFARDHLWWFDQFGYPDGWDGPRYEAPPQMPRPIDKWLCLGPFEVTTKDETTGRRVNFADKFPPETEGVAIDKTYSGLHGLDIAWKPAFMATPRIIDCERSFPDAGHYVKDVAGFFAAWVFSPEPREARFHVCADYFHEIWLNGEKVVAEGKGPHNRFRAFDARLRKGWNEVMVKVEPGAGAWHFGMAMDDFDGLEISAEQK